MAIKLLIVTSKSAGGSGKHIEMLAKGLSKAGLIVDLIYFKHGFDQDVLIERYFNTVHVFPHKIGFNFGIVLKCLLNKNNFEKISTGSSIVTHRSAAP